MKRGIFIAAAGIGVGTLFLMTACTTQADLRREHEIERLKQDLRDVKGSRVDIDVVGEELKNDLSRISHQQDEQAQLLRAHIEESRKEMATLTNRIQSLEQKVAALDEPAPQKPPPERQRPSYELGKKFYDEGRYGEATEVLETVLKSKPSADDERKARFLLAESFFADKEYATAALEFSEFRKRFPKDSLVPSAIFKQAASFRGMGKGKEAKLFYQELIEKYPKNPFAAKAKVEMKKIK